MGREGFGFRVSFGEGDILQRCSVVWWESVGNVLKLTTRSSENKQLYLKQMINSIQNIER